MKTSEFVAAQIEESKRLVEKYSLELETAFQEMDANRMSLAGSLKSYHQGRLDAFILMEARTIILESDLQLAGQFKNATLAKEVE